MLLLLLIPLFPIWPSILNTCLTRFSFYHVRNLYRHIAFNYSNFNLDQIPSKIEPTPIWLANEMITSRHLVDELLTAPHGVRKRSLIVRVYIDTVRLLRDHDWTPTQRKDVYVAVRLLPSYCLDKLTKEGIILNNGWKKPGGLIKSDAASIKTTCGLSPLLVENIPFNSLQIE